MKYAIIGTGAIGGFYGARLAKSGQEVHFLLHRDYDYVVENGLQIDSCQGSFHLDKPNVYRSAADMPVADVVLVGLKTTNNHLLKELLPPVTGPDTVVVLIQNGIGVEQDVQAMLPGIQLAAGLAFICSAKNSPGRITHQWLGRISFGNYSCRDAAVLERLVEEFTAAGIEARMSEYHEARWKKAVWNMPFNGMTAAMNTHTDQLLRHPATRRLIKEQMLEVIGAARSLGVQHMEDSLADKMIAMTETMPSYSPSMKLDHDYHRPMEIHYLYTRAREIAHEAGFEMPRLAMLEALLRYVDVDG